jgi:hypothetical protein
MNSTSFSFHTAAAGHIFAMPISDYFSGCDISVIGPAEIIG